MKKAAILLAFFGFILTSCGGGYKPVEPEKVDTSSLRKMLKQLNWSFVSIDEKETIVLYHNNPGSMTSNTMRLTGILTLFCKKHGGQIKAAGKTIDELTEGYKGLMKNEIAHMYFGTTGITYYCVGGDYPFEVNVYKGASRYYKTIKTDRYFIFAQIISEKPDVMIDNRIFDEEKLKKYSQWSLKKFIEKNKSKLFSLGSLHIIKESDKEIRGTFLTSAPYPSSNYNPGNVLRFLWELVTYCKAHGGDLKKYDEEKGKIIPFRLWFKDLLLNKKGAPFHGTGYLAYSNIAGTYFCDDADVVFTAEIREKGYMHQVNGFNHFVYIFPGEKPTISVKDIDKLDKEVLEKFTVKVKLNKEVFDEIGQVAVKTSQIRSDYFKEIGQKQYRGIYIYNDGKCDRVAVVVNFKYGKTPPDIINVKVCNGKVRSKSVPITFPYIPKEVLENAVSVAKRAKELGYAEYDDSRGFKIVAVPLRDEKMCLVEARIIKDGDLVKLLKINACQ